jgi:HNH endonuclease
VTRPHRVRHLLSPLWLLVALTTLSLNASSAAAASAPETRVRASDHVAVDAVAVHETEGPASVGWLRPAPPVLVSRSCVAPEAVPPIKPGASGGPTAGKPFEQATKTAVVAENLAVTGGDMPVCVWCHMETTTPHLDHAIPTSLGGNATVTNGQVSCPHCNLSRGNRPTPVTPPEGYEGPWPPPWWPSP